MKTTLEIDDDLLKAAKQRALDTGGTLRQIVETALVQHLKVRSTVSTPIKTVVFGNSSLGAGKSNRVSANPGNVLPESLANASYEQTSKAYWKKRFGMVPPGIK